MDKDYLDKIRQSLKETNERKELPPSRFLGSSRTMVIGCVGLIALHVIWYRFADAYVPEESQTRYFKMMKKIDQSMREFIN